MRKIKYIDKCEELKLYYEELSEYDKNAIKTKIINLKSSFLPELEINFEKNIESVMKKIKIEEDTIISGDFSYFIGVLIIFNFRILLNMKMWQIMNTKFKNI